jgi:hypothetical protein
VHGPEPVQAPPQPPKTDPAPGVAVRVTDVPVAKFAVQAVLHASPAGALVTVPVPPPETVTASPADVEEAKVAVTVVVLAGVTVQVPVPEHPPPDQPVNTEPAAAVAVRTTELPEGKLAEHVVPHAMPPGALVTLPLPSPARTTVTTTGAGANAALTAVAVVIVSVQVPVPEQPPPDQPLNTEPAAAVAVSVTLVPGVNVAEHVAPQLMPAGELATVPLPVRLTLRVTGPVTAGNS